jgi:hypothetical protein
VSGDGHLFVLEALNPAEARYSCPLTKKEVDEAQWWRLDWWWGHQP